MKHSSVALPDRYEKSGPPPVVTNNFMISISFIIGACGVAVMGMSLTLKTTEFFNFGNFILDILDQTPFVEFTVSFFYYFLLKLTPKRCVGVWIAALGLVWHPGRCHTRYFRLVKP